MACGHAANWGTGQNLGDVRVSAHAVAWDDEVGGEQAQIWETRL